MATAPAAPPRRRPSSSSSSSTITTTAAAASTTTNSINTTGTSPAPPSPAPSASSLSTAAAAAAAAPSLLQPRVAVVLKVPPRWHPWLFFFRLISILPASWWGLPSLLRLLLHFLPGPPDHFLLVPPGTAVGGGHTPASVETTAAAASCAAFQNGPAGAVVAAPYALTETALATIWCFACGYLSFFFTDCLMSRWLINYTPQATIVRLLSINAVNAYLTLSVLSSTGGFDDPRLLLPGWVAIATTLTVCYHITHQKINIRKETSTSVNVFSIASYITMVVLLVHMQAYEANYPVMPLVVRGKSLWLRAGELVARAKRFVHEHAEVRGEL